MWKLTISMAIFNGYVSLPEGLKKWSTFWNMQKTQKTLSKQNKHNCQIVFRKKQIKQMSMNPIIYFPGKKNVN
jgi:hypothetical protein